MQLERSRVLWTPLSRAFSLMLLYQWGLGLAVDGGREVLPQEDHLWCPCVQGHTSLRVVWRDFLVHPLLAGMVQAWVAHFVTPLKSTYDEYGWQVTSQKPHKKHKQHDKQHHHGIGAARPSSGMYSMNPCRLRGGRPCACLFQGRRQSDLTDSIN